MKKYLFGLLAITLAIGFSSFKSYRVNYSFNYIGPNFLEGNVEDRAQWQITTSPTCSSDDAQQACTLVFAEAQTELVGIPAVRKLKTSGVSEATIIATQYQTSGKFYVTSGNSVSKFNALQP
jgi:hypothetical protein